MAKSTEKKLREISREAAQKEVFAWLDFKKVRKNKREEYEAQIENLISAFEEGLLVLDPETFVITQNLLDPIEYNGIVSTLSHKPRVKSFEIDNALKGLKVEDQNGRVRAYVQASTGLGKSVLQRLDSNDNNLANDLIVFFLT